ncbi:integrase [Streptococcus acidominimus]|uniref:Integrase n=1 Tax=Streptococcus acidominimus TaxID=1326 RepID=A0A4Y9FPN4_STRAI|nr:integrase [Streptococcus acidominimus]
MKKYNLPTIKPHGFRHTHISLLFEAGASLKEVQERVGHEDIKTTMNIYTHVTENIKEKTAEKFAQFLGS